jgi:hypothetical protein
VKLVDISGIKKNENLKANIDELETNSKIKKHQTCIEVSMTLRRVTSLEYSKR